MGNVVVEAVLVEEDVMFFMLGTTLVNGSTAAPWVSLRSSEVAQKPFARLAVICLRGSTPAIGR